MKKKLQSIYQIIPEEYKKKSLRYLLLSLMNIFLDLVSVAYLIPLFVFLLDKNQMPLFLKKISFFNQDYAAYWVAGIVFLFVVKNSIQIIIIRFQATLVFDIATRLSVNLTRQFLNKPFLEIQELDKGKEIQKIQLSGTDFANHILLSINTFFTELLVLGIIGIVSLILYPKFSVYIFLIAVISLFLIYRFRKKKIDSIGKSIRKSYSQATSHLLNIIDGFLEIKSLRKDSFFQHKYESTLTRFNSYFSVLKKYQQANAKFLEIVIIVGLSLFLFYVNIVFSNTTGKVVLISFVAGISLKLFPSLNKLIIAYTNFKSYQYTLDVLTDLPTDFQEEHPSFVFKNTIELKNVSFSYSKNHILLKDVCLTISKGETIGIKGRSGIGKTTLLNIIMGLLTPQKGEIILNGNKVERKKNVLFNFVGYVPQQPFLFQGSLLENITMNEDEQAIDINRIETLIESFELQKFVARLPQGIHTKLTHDTLQISGGQKQRIALIRALYAQPQLLILDEVTNQLDEELEEKIIYFLKKHTQKNNIATIMVSHSPVVHQVCDRVFSISQHTLIEE